MSSDIRSNQTELQERLMQPELNRLMTWPPERILEEPTNGMTTLCNAICEQAKSVNLEVSQIDRHANGDLHPILQVGIDCHSIVIGRLLKEGLDQIYGWYTGEAFLLRGKVCTPDDVRIFLVGPDGSNVDSEWRMYAQRIESNERVCRKLVWLPPANEAEHSLSLDTLFKRSFLARPWRQAAPAEGELDYFSDMFQRHFQSNMTQNDSVNKEWLSILRKVHDNRERLAELLINSFGTEHGGAS